MTRKRSAFTLLEIVIAMAIFMVVMAAVTESVLSARVQHDLQADMDDLVLDGDRALNQIRADLVQSGWYFATGSIDSVTGKMSSDDRKIRYFPYIQQQAPAGQGATDPLGAGLGSAFKHTWRSGSMVAMNAPDILRPGSPTDALATAGAGYFDSWHARSEEIIFLRVLQGGWSATPWSKQPADNAYVNFGGKLADWQTGNIGTPPAGGKQDQLKMLHPSPYVESPAGSGLFVLRTGLDADADGIADEPYGVYLQSGLLQPNDDREIEPAWETMGAPDYGWRGSPPTFQGVDQADLREYMYAVVPSRVGLGRLVRAIKVDNAQDFQQGVEVGQRISRNSATNEGMVIDLVLSDHVVRALFSTFRTTVDLAATTAVNEQLDVNQVRVRLFLARFDRRTGSLVPRIIEAVVAMRAKQGATWVSRDQEILGETGISFPR